MPQQTNLNVSPYYDDFDPSKGYHRVLFKPGFPVQARELSTLQSILQNQIETYGSHIFKEGALVIPGSTTFDGNYFAVQVNPTHLGTDVSVYANNVIGKRFKGQNSGVTAKVINYITATESDRDYDTFYVKYIDSSSDGDFSFFQDGEVLVAEEPITYGNTTINIGGTLASTIALNACTTGSACSIDEGVYFIRGNFVKVNKQTIILDQYNQSPSYRIGLQVLESTVSAKGDESLYDNAKGFSNFAAPGADRLQITLILSKKSIDDFDDTDFVEVLRIKDGQVFSLNRDNEYNRIRDYFAKRTYDESGNYTVNPFGINVAESLNDRLGNDGVYFKGQTTFDSNEPDDDLACLKVTAGKAYIYGYDVDVTTPQIIDFEKPRSIQTVENQSFNFEMGNRFLVNNVSGITTLTERIELMGGPIGGSLNAAGTSQKIGDAKVYGFSLRDAAYENNGTDWNLYLYDIQTYTALELNDNVSSDELNQSGFIVGKESGAEGYAVSAGAGSSSIQVTQTAGTFRRGEKISINGDETVSRTIEKVTTFGINDVYEFAQSGNSFTASKKLNQVIPVGFGAGQFNIAADGTVTSPRADSFLIFKPGDIFSYGAANDTSGSSLNVPTRNVVLTVAADGQQMKVGTMTTVADVFDGGVKAFEGIGYRGVQDVNLSRTGVLVSNDSRTAIISVASG